MVTDMLSQCKKAVRGQFINSETAELLNIRCVCKPIGQEGWKVVDDNFDAVAEQTVAVGFQERGKLALKQKCNSMAGSCSR
jgi:hypothetical protein